MPSPSIACGHHAGLLTRLLCIFGVRARRYVRQRSFARLEGLDQRLLRDIGLTRTDIRRMRRHW